jgi:hypothetical protein
MQHAHEWPPLSALSAFVGYSKGTHRLRLRLPRSAAPTREYEDAIVFAADPYLVSPAAHNDLAYRTHSDRLRTLWHLSASPRRNAPSAIAELYIVRRRASPKSSVSGGRGRLRLS